MTTTLKVGDRVAYAKHFLQSTGMITGNQPQARGRIVELTSKDTIARIEWEKPFDDVPGKVHVANLSRVTPERGIEEPQ